MSIAKIIKQVIEIAKTDHEMVKAIKSVLIKGQKYEVAANLRDFERKNYDCLDHNSPESERAYRLRTALSTVDINAGFSTCLKVNIVFDILEQDSDKFDMEKAKKMCDEIDKKV